MPLLREFHSAVEPLAHSFIHDHVALLSIDGLGGFIYHSLVGTGPPGVQAGSRAAPLGAFFSKEGSSRGFSWVFMVSCGPFFLVVVLFFSFLFVFFLRNNWTRRQARHHVALLSIDGLGGFIYHSLVGTGPPGVQAGSRAAPLGAFFSKEGSSGGFSWVFMVSCGPFFLFAVLFFIFYLFFSCGTTGPDGKPGTT